MKVTIYELLGMIKDGKVPKKIKYQDMIFKYNEEKADYIMIDDTQYFLDWVALTINGLNDEVEIIEEPQEHKIPEKLKIEQDTPNSNFYIRNEYGTKCALTKHSKIIADKINEIIDYLEEKE